MSDKPWTYPRMRKYIDELWIEDIVFSEFIQQVRSVLDKAEAAGIVPDLVRVPVQTKCAI